jgi:hypothetical protein
MPSVLVPDPHGRYSGYFTAQRVWVLIEWCCSIFTYICLTVSLVLSRATETSVVPVAITTFHHPRLMHISRFWPQNFISELHLFIRYILPGIPTHTAQDWRQFPTVSAILPFWDVQLDQTRADNSLTRWRRFQLGWRVDFNLESHPTSAATLPEIWVVIWRRSKTFQNGNFSFAPSVLTLAVSISISIACNIRSEWSNFNRRHCRSIEDGLGGSGSCSG